MSFNIANTEHTIVAQCIKGDRNAQKTLYNTYAAKLLGVAHRYVNDRAIAEDILLEGFLKIFKYLESFEGKGSLEGWMRKIVSNEALMWLRKNKTIIEDIDNVFDLHNEDEGIDDILAHQEIMEVVMQLPVGYRTIFNLYIIEGYKHKEIAEILDISINTSKSQLIMAKKKLSALILEKMKVGQ